MLTMRSGETMDPIVRLGLDFYLQQQCLFVRFAYEDLVRELHEEGRQRNTDRIWYSVYAFLTASANISKVLNPIRGDESRGVELRAAYDIGKGATLMDRSMRDVLEHYDEYFEKYIRKHPDRGFPSFSIYSGCRPGDTTNRLMALDASHLVVSFLDKSCRLEDIRATVENLLPRVEIDIRSLMSKRVSSD